ncbi:MAG: heparin lyase I family protein [Spirochaetia bacterium]
MTVSITWSQTEAGSAEVWIDGEPMTAFPVTGPNMLNKESHYFKFGLYRNPNIGKIQTVY